ncbi:MAG: DUF4236 domain-containing protein [Lentisphaeria bacterium]|nr:DUF4236 domain-containing protein [Lentisphaeria bacterium]
MGWRFYRRIKIFPGVTMNIGKNGTSYTLGSPGMTTNISSRGIRHTYSISGTGISYQTPLKRWSNNSTLKKKLSVAERQQIIKQSDYQKLNLGFFEKLILSSEEKNLVKGIQAYIIGDILQAETLLKKSTCYADAIFILGFIYLNSKRFNDAIIMFEQAERCPKQIGCFFQRYQLEMTLTLSLSPFLSVEFPPELLTAYLAHAEALQQLQKITEACNILLSLYKKNPQNHLVIISLAELVLKFAPNDTKWMNAIINLTKNVNNETYIQTVMLMYKAEAFTNLGMHDAAITTLTSALRRKADRPLDLLIELQYKRGFLYSKMGKKTQAIKDLQEVFVQDPNYANVKQLLAQLV